MNDERLSQADYQAKTAAKALRIRAEELARRKMLVSPIDADTMSLLEMRDTLYHLRLIQVELELQNEELRRLQLGQENERARYLDLYNNAPVGYCTISITGMITEANMTAETLLGMGRGTLVNSPITRYVYKLDQDIYYIEQKNLYETNQPQECEVRMVKSDDTLVWVKLTATSSADAEGAKLYRVVLSDINSRKQTDEGLQLKEEYYKKLFGIHFNQLEEKNSVYNWEINQEGLYTNISQNCKNILGYEPGEVVGVKSFSDFHPENGREVFKSAVLEIIARKQSFNNMQHLITTANGTCLMMSADGVPLLDNNGNLSGYRGIDTYVNFS